MKHYKTYIKKYGIKGFFAILFLSIEAFCDVLQPTLLAVVINEGVRYQDLDKVLKYGAVMIGVALFGAINATMRNIIASHVSYHFGAELRVDLFSRLLKLSQKNIDSYDEGSLITRISNDVVQVQHFVQGVMRIFLKAPLIGIGSIVMSIRLYPAFGYVYAVLLPLIVMAIVMNMNYGYPMFSKIQSALDALNHRIQSLLAGIRVVKAFNRFGYEFEQFEKDNVRLTDLSATTYRTIAVFPPMMTLFVNLAMVFVLWRGAYWVQIGVLGLGDIMAVIHYLMQFLFALMVLARVFVMFVRAKASSERIVELLLDKPDIDNRKSGVELDIKGAIAFEKVSYSYGKGALALDDISFRIEPGEKVGIIGSTGSGKTTLVNLILRHYDTLSGTISIDGQPIKDHQLMHLRKFIGVVPQKNNLFTGTIMDNIRWGNQMAGEDEIRLYAQIACADGFIEGMPGGYDAKIGRGGVNVSGGQKQRLAIARALVKKPKILILDDSTSAIDVITENKLKAQLKTTFEKMTTIIVAQRISSVMDLDKIIVLNDGKLESMGTHEELMGRSTIYTEIYASQLGSEVRR
ncbi:MULTISPECIES: ABC transporter ATP-binding protein [unclassified Fusibacter]|uniref:ABC transporter ATP-binding protein n=1 Tax=unclassified Fusibacter TaxID=2624464 RepID=UPI001010A8F7|nr:MULTISPECIES: ABC transporter ATP-binding protein [unclassified Fusibacter]MCK8060014.1 ABC transporter ATP-binding protein/permease [Fusibacter sp. A2]NPE22154.1 ABC transporter ATP-binding protein [Fusibacter sp. A1]RXV60931.1 ABC transporter ATP-binding protein [Fusibacter sp. A1]